MKKNYNPLIAVCSRSVSKNDSAVKILKKKFKNIRLNNTGKILKDSGLINFMKGASAAIIGLEKIDEKLLKKCLKLKIIGKYGVGTNNIDFKALKKNNIKILLQPGINKRAVSELTLSFMIQGLRNSYQLISDVKNNKWPFKFGRLLSGKTVGIIGFGNIGSDLFELLRPFGCKIMVNDILPKNNFLRKKNIKNSLLKSLLKNSDIISLHIPLNKKNSNFFSKKEFSLLKKNIVLINTSRGGIVDEKYLYKFLKKNENSHALFDVMLKEPIKDKKLLNLKNFSLTPHLAGSTVEIAETASTDCVKKVAKYFKK